MFERAEQIWKNFCFASPLCRQYHAWHARYYFLLLSTSTLSIFFFDVLAKVIVNDSADIVAVSAI